MADTNFLQKAITIVQQATEKDNAKDYAEAQRLYMLSLEYFMTALKCSCLHIAVLFADIFPPDEKNEKCKATIRSKVEEYLARAEKLKEFLEKQQKKPVAQGSGGKSNGGKDDKEDDESNKFKEALSSA